LLEKRGVRCDERAQLDVAGGPAIEIFFRDRVNAAAQARLLRPRKSRGDRIAIGGLPVWYSICRNRPHLSLACASVVSAAYSMNLVTPSHVCRLLVLLLAASSASGAEAISALPPLPPPMNIPKAGPVVNGIYQPQPILPGGVVVPLFPADSPYLKKEKLGEPEVYSMNGSMPGRIQSIVGIHNPSIEFHAGIRSLNTGMAVIVVAGGGHNTLNVGGEGADFVHFFANYGINTVILRNRLRRDGYMVQTDAVADAQQAIRVVRAYAKQWQLDPRKIGIMGFSAGAELATPAAIKWKEFDEKNAVPGNPFAQVSSRPDFVGVIYPGPTPFTRPRNATEWSAPEIPRDTPPSFVVCAGWGDRGHAIWADDWFTAMLQADIPNVEMHIYARGRHPGDQPWPDDPPSTGGLTPRGRIALGTWHFRFLDWARDLRFLEKPGVATLAEIDSAANLSRPPPGQGRGRGGAGSTRGSTGTPEPKSTAAPGASVPR
jgi:acetyl esterase/lipase